MVIVETSIFTKLIKQLKSDGQYRELQEALVNRPDLGDLIRGSGGLRKVRWKLDASKKSGGIRVIYYWFAHIARVNLYLKSRCVLTIRAHHLSLHNTLLYSQGCYAPAL